MRILSKLLKSQVGSTLINTMIGAALLSGVAVLVSQGITQQRTQTVKLNAGGACQVVVKNAIENLKKFDNNRQVANIFTPRHPATSLTPVLDAAAIIPEHFNFKPIFDATNPNMGAAALGAENVTAIVSPTGHIKVTNPFNPAADCAGNCGVANNDYNNNAVVSAANASLTYQYLNSATTRVAYYYNLNPTFCADRVDVSAGGNFFSNEVINLGQVAQASGINNPSIFATIERVNLTNGAVDCGDQGSFKPIPPGSTGGASSLSVYGLKVTLTLEYADQEGTVKGCVASNTVSQTKLRGRPTSSAPQFVATGVTRTIPADPTHPVQFCGDVESVGTFTTPQIQLDVSASGDGVLNYCRMEYMPTNMGVAGAYAGYQYADSGWFLCSMPPTDFRAGVDPSTIDPTDIMGSLRDQVGNRSLISFSEVIDAGTGRTRMLMDNLPEGHFRVSSFSVDASRTASAIQSNNFSVDLIRPVGANGLSPVSGNVVGEFNSPSMRLVNLADHIPPGSPTGLANTIEGYFGRVGNGSGKLYQCQAGNPQFEVTGMIELTPITDAGNRWYVGPSGVTDPQLDTYFDYDATEVNTFNTGSTTEFITACNIGVVGVSSRNITNTAANSGEWVAVAGTCDLCGNGSANFRVKRHWIADLGNGATGNFSNLRLDTVAPAPSGTQTKRNPSFNYSFGGEKPNHQIGRFSGTKQLPFGFVCEVADNTAPDVADKSRFSYNVEDIKRTIHSNSGTDPHGNILYTLLAGELASGNCTQSNFQDACRYTPGSDYAVPVIDACGRVDRVMLANYEVEGISDGAGRNDKCGDVDCAPGYYCDKNGAETGICKTPQEVNWLTNKSYKNCNGSGCGTNVTCGENVDCANDVSPIAQCSGQQVGCTGDGTSSSDIIGTPAVPVSPVNCLSPSQLRDHNVSIGPTESGCNYGSTNGVTNCSYQESRTNPYVRHTTTGQNLCAPPGGYKDWRNGTSTSCSNWGSIGSCAAYPTNTECSVPAGTTRYCSSGASRSFTIGTPISTSTCTTTPAGCGSYSFIQQWTEPTPSDCLLNTAGRTCLGASPPSCSSVGDIGNNCCIIDEYMECECTSPTPPTTICAANDGDCATELTGWCTTAAEVGNTKTCKSGSDVHTYRCQIDSCNIPTRECTFRPGTPPWANLSNNNTIDFDGKCHVRHGSCTNPTRTKSNSGTNLNINCPNIDPFGELGACAAPVCTDYNAGWCAGEAFSVANCTGGPDVACSGVTTPSCPAGYNLVNKDILGCLADPAGYDECISESTGCNTLTAGWSCGRKTSCTAQENHYATQAACDAAHSTCLAIPTGYCGSGCHASITHTGATATACEGGSSGNRSCREPVGITGGGAFCATTCDVGNGETSYPDLASCTAGNGGGPCTPNVVYDASTDATKTIYCGTVSQCAVGETQYDDLEECLSANANDLSKCKNVYVSGSCQSLESCTNWDLQPDGNYSCNASGVPALGDTVSGACCTGSPASCTLRQNYSYIDSLGNTHINPLMCGSAAPAGGKAWTTGRCLDTPERYRLLASPGTGAACTATSGRGVCLNSSPASSVCTGFNDRISVFNSAGTWVYEQERRIASDCSDMGGSAEAAEAYCTPEPTRATSYGWVTTTPNVSISRTACEAHVFPQSSCPPSECTNSSDLGKTCKQPNRACSNVGASLADEKTCQDTSVAGTCWVQTGQTTDRSTTNPAGHPVERFNCSSGVETSLPNSCTNGNTCNHEWQFGTTNYQCQTITAGTTCAAPPVPATDCRQYWCAAADTGNCNAGETEYTSKSLCESGATGCRSVSTGTGLRWGSNTRTSGAGVNCPAAYHMNKGNCFYQDGSSDSPTPTLGSRGFPRKTCPSEGFTADCYECATGDYDFLYSEFTCETVSTSAWCGVEGTPPPPPALPCTIDMPASHTVHSYPKILPRSGGRVEYTGGSFRIITKFSHINRSFCGGIDPVPNITDPNKAVWINATTGLCTRPGVPGPDGLAISCPQPLEDYEFRIIIDESMSGEDVTDFSFSHTVGAGAGRNNNASNYDTGWGSPGNVLLGISIEGDHNGGECESSVGRFNFELSIRDPGNPSAVVSKNVSVVLRCAAPAPDDGSTSLED